MNRGFDSLLGSWAFRIYLLPFANDHTSSCGSPVSHAPWSWHSSGVNNYLVHDRYSSRGIPSASQTRAAERSPRSPSSPVTWLPVVDTIARGENQTHLLHAHWGSMCWCWLEAVHHQLRVGKSRGFGWANPISCNFIQLLLEPSQAKYRLVTKYNSYKYA